MPPQEVTRRLAAILVADVVGYSRLIEQAETGTISDLRRVWAETFNPAVAARRGRIVKTMGDGALVEFGSVVDAVECAVAIQRAMNRRNRTSGRLIAFRMGINLGDIVIDGDDIFGEGVNIAARLEPEAPSGGILASDIVHAQVAGKVGVTFVDSGEIRLKNIERPLRVWRWDCDDVGSADEQGDQLTAPAPAKPTVAVLPFTNLSSDAEQEFFAAGLALDLEAALGIIDGIALLANSASADYHLGGSVRASAGLVRVNARLASAADSRQVWSGRFDGRTDDIFTFQDEITRQVAVALQVNLTSGDYARLWDGQTRSLPAWERCVVANGYHERWTEADNRRARELLLEALDIDPDYVAAKVLLAKTWWYDARFYAEGPDLEHALSEAERVAQDVLARRPDSGNALMMLGATAWLYGRHDDALALCRKAASLSHGDAWVTGFFGVLSVYSGDLDEAVTVLERAARMSPQTFTWINFHIGHARAWLGDDADAQASLHRYVAMNPDDTWGHLMLAFIHGHFGRTEDARRAVGLALRSKPDIDSKQVRRANPYRDPERLEHVMSVLGSAGLPD
jgi:class 3 adenylate cyclase/TolB-like protein